MADVTVKVLTPATEFGFMSLDEAKTFLGIALNDTTQDAQLEQLIDFNSDTIATKCNNRVFAKERVQETWRCIGDAVCPPGVARLMLTHYPVKEADIETVETPAGTLITDYELEEKSGKLTVWGGYSDEIVVVYTGGYELPTEAPLALKQATGILTRESRTQAAAEAVTGIRMIAHGEARVMFHSPTQTGSTVTRTTGGSAAQRSVDTLLSHFTRLWL